MSFFFFSSWNAYKQIFYLKFLFSIPVGLILFSIPVAVVRFDLSKLFPPMTGCHRLRFFYRTCGAENIAGFFSFFFCFYYQSKIFKILIFFLSMSILIFLFSSLFFLYFLLFMILFFALDLNVDAFWCCRLCLSMADIFCSFFFVFFIFFLCSASPVSRLPVFCRFFFVFAIHKIFFKFFFLFSWRFHFFFYFLRFSFFIVFFQKKKTINLFCGKRREEERRIGGKRRERRES